MLYIIWTFWRNTLYNPFFFFKCRFLFWTEWGKIPCIGRSRLDGSDQVTLVNSGVLWPNGISIDYEVQLHKHALHFSSRLHATLTPSPHFHLWYDFSEEVMLRNLKLLLQENTLYWCDARTDRIEKINLETGENREIVLSAANVDLFSVAVFGPYIYWSDR